MEFLSDKEILYLQMDIINFLESPIMINVDQVEEMAERANRVSEDRQGNIVDLFTNIGVERRFSAPEIEIVAGFVNLVNYLKDSEMMKTEFEIISIHYHLDDEQSDKIEYFSNYKIVENNSFKYYSLLMQVFYKLQLFDRIDELKIIIDNSTI